MNKIRRYQTIIWVVAMVIGLVTCRLLRGKESDDDTTGLDKGGVEGCYDPKYSLR